MRIQQKDGRVVLRKHSFEYPRGHIKRTAQGHSWALPQTHLAVAGESGVVEEKVGTEEEDDGVKHTQACPIHEDRPAEEGVLCYVPDASPQENTSVE